MEHLSNDQEDISFCTRIVVSYAMKRGILFWVYWRVNGNWDTNMIGISHWRERHCRTNTCVRKRNTSNRAGLWESQSGIRLGKLTIWVRSFETEKLWQSSPGLSVPPEWVSQSLWWTLKSPKTNTLADGLIKRISSMLDETESKTMHNNNVTNKTHRRGRQFSLSISSCPD